MRILLVEGRFYEDISDELAEGAIAEITKHGFEYERLFVPGAIEIPSAINFANDSGRYDGYVALGCVMRGETYHFEIVCNESARGLTWLTIDKKIAIGNGILTVENEEQAMERASVSRGNKGAYAALACMEMIYLKNKFAKGGKPAAKKKTKKTSRKK